MRLLNRHFGKLLLVLALLPLQACGTMQSAESIEARVVDDKTGEPIKGMVVVAHWQLERKYAIPPGVVGYDPRGPLQLQIMETVTDQDGHFYFPAWGPLPVPPGAYLMDEDPAIVMFKPGHEFYSTTNEYPSTFDFSASSTRTSQINHTTIRMKKFEGDLKAYANALMLLAGRLDFAANPQESTCDWTRIPRMLAAVHEQKRIFQEAKIFSSLFTVDRLPFQEKCGSAKELLKEYLK